MEHKFKKYIVFSIEDYYPSGGLGDISGDFDTVEEAREFVSTKGEFYNEIIDRDTWEEVAKNDLGK